MAGTELSGRCRSSFATRKLTGRSYRVFYDDDDPNKLVREEQVEPGADEQGPKDGLMGAGFAEKALTSLLG